MPTRALVPVHPLIRCSSLMVLVFAAWLPSARAVLAVESSACAVQVSAEDDASPQVAIGCGCTNGDGTLPDSGDWGRGSGSGGVTLKALPGVVCHMNVGNIFGGDGVKIDTCAHLQGRAAEIVGADCDTISVVELMSDFQCARICDEDPASEQCAVCNGCSAGNTSSLACKRQAAVVCPPDKYDIQCTQAPPASVGCDCICRKKDVCAAQGPDCQKITNIRVDDLSWVDGDGESHQCSLGNYATCTRCTDPYGGPSMGNCVVHPDHCNDGNDEADREECLKVCSTGLLERAAAAIAGMEIRTMSGDFNCTPRGQACDGLGVSIAECPWLDAFNGFKGMEVCPQSDPTAAVGLEGCGGGSPIGGAGCPNCILDFVMSTDCGCGETFAVYNGIDYGDHRTIIFGQYNVPSLQYVSGSGHKLVHGHYTLKQSDGTSVQRSYSSEQFGNGLGFSCAAGASCGYYSSLGGTVTAQTDVCESRHQARVRQRTGCFRPAKALVCERAGAWGWASGQASGHGAQTVDIAGANATASGNNWQARCVTKRRIVDMRPISETEVASDPLLFLSNADASCTLRPPTPKPPPTSVTPGLD